MADETAEDIASRAWWAQPAAEVLEALDVDAEKGLDPGRVEAMRERYGANEMAEGGWTSLWDLTWESLTSPMMVLLLAVAGVSLALGRVREAIVMAVIVLIYVGVELYNKARSDRTMARLRELQAPQVTVVRDGEWVSVEVGQVVVGDILPLQPGSRVPADARLLSSAGLLVNEASLTGESTAQRKEADAAVDADADLAERPTAVFAGTTVLDGQGQAVVVAVGDETELERVAELTARAGEEPTLLQKEMEDLARTLKQEQASLFERGLLANRFGAKWLVGMVALVALVVAMVTVPFVREALETTGLSGTQWAMVVGGGQTAQGR